jgi:hypothetical protein
MATSNFKILRNGVKTMVTWLGILHQDETCYFFIFKNQSREYNWVLKS